MACVDGSRATVQHKSNTDDDDNDDDDDDGVLKCQPLATKELPQPQVDSELGLAATWGWMGGW